MCFSINEVILYAFGVEEYKLRLDGFETGCELLCDNHQQ